MRTIKFRAWDEGAKQMINWDEIESWQVRATFATPNSYPIMQFTGLLDKNGKEIYEGDVVEFIPGESISEGVSVVVYRENYASFNVSGDGYEILGNIWENPELLK